MQTPSSFKDKTVFITGASRGIGHAIGLRLAREGANIVIAAKTISEHDKLPGTIYSAAKDMVAVGSNCFPLQTDIRYEDQVAAAVEAAVMEFGGIDILVNNASAISLTGTLETEMKRYDLMHNINARGTFMVSRYCLPHLVKALNPHVLTLSPPLNMDARWFGPHVAYTMAKYAMSMCTLGMADEFAGRVAFNSLWPESTIATAAVSNILGGDRLIARSRTPAVVAEAAWFILQKNALLPENTGNFYTDVAVLAGAGVTNLKSYQVNPDLDPEQLQHDFFL